MSPALAGGFLTTGTAWEVLFISVYLALLSLWCGTQNL